MLNKQGVKQSAPSMLGVKFVDLFSFSLLLFSFQSALEEQFETHRDNHQRQLTNLRDEIQTQNDFIQQLKE